ncbi:unnamed protein product [Prorocentrum cordatum]|uniref:Uncharacterized protein n=1 Tax=Prorocentrum cordatum TaxID=2364126 RepID=A0ABN9PTB1_9DINO|nr:unnamed protein product [Polarella glacialis]
MLRNPAVCCMARRGPATHTATLLWPPLAAGGSPAASEKKAASATSGQEIRRERVQGAQPPRDADHRRPAAPRLAPAADAAPQPRPRREDHGNRRGRRPSWATTAPRGAPPRCAARPARAARGPGPRP